MDIKILQKKLVKIDNAISIAIPKEQPSLPIHQVWIAGLFMFARSLFKGIIALFQSGLTQESKVLLRALIEVSLKLMYLSEHKEDEIGLVAWLYNQDLREWKNIVKEAENVGREQNANEMRESITEKRAKLIGYLEKLGASMIPFPSTKAMAKDLGKESAYLNYKYLSLSVHSGLNVVRDKMDISKGSVKVSLHQFKDEDGIHDIAAEAAEWIIGASVSFGKIIEIELDELKKISVLGTDGKEILENVKI